MTVGCSPNSSRVSSRDLACRNPQLVEPPYLGCRERLEREIGQRLATPQGKRTLEQRQGIRGAFEKRARDTGLCEKAFEADVLDVLRGRHSTHIQELLVTNTVGATPFARFGSNTRRRFEM